MENISELIKVLNSINKNLVRIAKALEPEKVGFLEKIKKAEDLREPLFTEIDQDLKTALKEFCTLQDCKYKAGELFFWDVSIKAACELLVNNNQPISPKMLGTSARRLGIKSIRKQDGYHLVFSREDLEKV